jgi:biotin carboxylase
MKLTAQQKKEINDTIAKGAIALGIDNSMLNVDMIMTQKGPKIIEIGARMGATCLPELTTIYSGIDMVGAAIDMAMGVEPTLKEKKEKQPCAALLIRSEKAGILEIAEYPNSVTGDKRIVDIRWDKKTGDKVSAFKSGPDRIGEIVVKGASKNEAEKLCNELYDGLNIKVI